MLKFPVILNLLSNCSLLLPGFNEILQAPLDAMKNDISCADVLSSVEESSTKQTSMIRLLLPYLTLLHNNVSVKLYCSFIEL